MKKISDSLNQENLFQNLHHSSFKFPTISGGFKKETTLNCSTQEFLPSLKSRSHNLEGKNICQVHKLNLTHQCVEESCPQKERICYRCIQEKHKDHNVELIEEIKIEADSQININKCFKHFSQLIESQNSSVHVKAEEIQEQTPLLQTTHIRQEEKSHLNKTQAITFPQIHSNNQTVLHSVIQSYPVPQNLFNQSNFSQSQQVPLHLFSSQNTHHHPENIQSLSFHQPTNPSTLQFCNSQALLSQNKQQMQYQQQIQQLQLFQSNNSWIPNLQQYFNPKSQFICIPQQQLQIPIQSHAFYSQNVPIPQFSQNLNPICMNDQINCQQQQQQQQILLFQQQQQMQQQESQMLLQQQSQQQQQWKQQKQQQQQQSSQKQQQQQQSSQKQQKQSSLFQEQQDKLEEQINENSSLKQETQQQQFGDLSILNNSENISEIQSQETKKISQIISERWCQENKLNQVIKIKNEEIEMSNQQYSQPNYILKIPFFKDNIESHCKQVKSMSKKVQFSIQNKCLRSQYISIDKVVQQHIDYYPSISAVTAEKLIMASVNTFEMKYFLTMMDARTKKVMMKQELNSSFQSQMRNLNFDENKRIILYRVNDHLTAVYERSSSFVDLYSNVNLKFLHRIPFFQVQSLYSFNKGRCLAIASLRSSVSLYSLQGDRPKLMRVINIPIHQLVPLNRGNQQEDSNEEEEQDISEQRVNSFLLSTQICIEEGIIYWIGSEINSYVICALNISNFDEVIKIQRNQYPMGLTNKDNAAIIVTHMSVIDNRLYIQFQDSINFNSNSLSSIFSSEFNMVSNYTVIQFKIEKVIEKQDPKQKMNERIIQKERFNLILHSSNQKVNIIHSLSHHKSIFLFNSSKSYIYGIIQEKNLKINKFKINITQPSRSGILYVFAAQQPVKNHPNAKDGEQILTLIDTRRLFHKIFLHQTQYTTNLL